MAAAAAAAAAAATRALGVPEILLPVLAHTQRDRVDLLSASRVSRLFRRVALSVLLRALDIPLARLTAFTAAFRQPSSRPFLEHVRFLRIWDDDAHTHFRCHLESAPTGLHESRAERDLIVAASTPFIERRDSRWDDELHAFLELLTADRHAPLPPLDLSIGVIHTAAASRLLKHFPEVAARISALRIVNQTLPKFDQSARSWWAHLRDLVRTICEAQDERQLDTLKLFSIESHGKLHRSTSCASDVFWIIAKYLSPRISELVLSISDDILAPSQWSALLKGNLPNLTRFHFEFRPEVQHVHPRADILRSFLEANPQLTGLHVRLSPRAGYFLDLSGPVFPNLKTIDVDWEGPRSLADFLEAHPHLSHLGMGTWQPNQRAWIQQAPGDDADLPAHSIQHLKTARGHWRRIQRLTALGARLSHWDFSNAMHSTSELDRLTGQAVSASSTPDTDAEAAPPPAHPSVTCLTLEPRREHLDDILVQLPASLHRTVFPHLAELVLCCHAGCARPPKEEDDDDVAAAATTTTMTMLRRILRALRMLPALRVLHVEYAGARALPDARRDDGDGNGDGDSTVAAAVVADFEARAAPRRLEYVAWVCPARNETRYFRVEEEAAVEHAGDDHDDHEEDADGRRRRYLLPLPRSSRLWVDDGRAAHGFAAAPAGVWSGVSADLYASKVFLDHSVFPPRARS